MTINLHQFVVDKNTTTNSKNNTDLVTTSACLLIMDDNHWLVEWIAYHYLMLSLRNIIVAVDGRSRTSPLSILDRWSHRIQWEVWNDRDYQNDAPSYGRSLQQLNLERQQSFLAKCLKTFQQREHRWVFAIDTDEFVVMNPKTSDKHHSLYRDYSPVNMFVPGSISKFIDEEHRRRKAVCFAIGRMQFNSNEPNSIPPTLAPFNGSNFLTMRWQNAAANTPFAKNIVDLKHVNTYFPGNRTNQHQLLPNCPNGTEMWDQSNSLLQIYHYLGTWDQHTFRDDPRWYEKKNGGRNVRFHKFANKQSLDAVHNMTPWLVSFVQYVGMEEAIHLLDGVGQVQGWDAYTST